MNAATRRSSIAGPAGALECAVDTPPADAWPQPLGLAVLCHPHPLHGGTMDNKVVQTLARAVVQMGWTSVRFNFRGIGASQGAWDAGQGEIDDALAVINAHRNSHADAHPHAHPDAQAPQRLLLGGFSFGGYVAANAAHALPQAHRPERLILAAPAVGNFKTPAVPTGTLVVHGELDDVVPLQALLDWARPQALPVTVLPGAGHFFHGQLPVLKHIVLAALSQTALPS